MRIGGGRARGTRLRAKGGRGVRPTSTLVSDAVFNSLAPRIAGACVLDLFAGTGRLGIEALSREGGRRLRENTLAIALYPGSFDPVHNGHLDIIERARRMARRVVVGVATNVEKEPMFSIGDRVAMLRAATERAGVEVMSFG